MEVNIYIHTCYTHTRTHMDSHSHTQKVFVEGTDLGCVYYPYISAFNCSSAYSLRQLNDNHIACTPHTTHHTPHRSHTPHTTHRSRWSLRSHRPHRPQITQITDPRSQAHTTHAHVHTLLRNKYLWKATIRMLLTTLTSLYSIALLCTDSSPITKSLHYPPASSTMWPRWIDCKYCLCGVWL